MASLIINNKLFYSHYFLARFVKDYNLGYGERSANFKDLQQIKEKFSSELCRQDSIPQLKSAILGTSRRLETTFFTNLFLACGTEIIVWLSF